MSVCRATIRRVSDTWPPPGPQKREALLEHIRDVWTLRYIETNCTAVIWRNDFGLELRVEHGGELIESSLSRYGIEPLLLIADQIRANLIAQGWFEPTNARHWWDNTERSYPSEREKYLLKSRSPS